MLKEAGSRTFRHRSFAGHTNCPWITAILRRRSTYSTGQTKQGQQARVATINVDFHTKDTSGCIGMSDRLSQERH